MSGFGAIAPAFILGLELLLLLSIPAVCFRAETLGRRLGLLDYPDATRKLHLAPTPLVGGVASIVPLLAVAALEGWRQPEHAGLFAVLAVAIGAFLLLGLADDRNQVSVTARLILSTLVLTVALALHPALHIQTLVLVPGEDLAVPLGLLAGPFTLLCLLGFQNAVNMADGANGVVLGLAVGWTGLILPHAPPELTPFLWLFGAAMLATLPFNLRGRLFLGDAGSYAVSVLVGLAVIYTYNRSDGLSALNVMLWLLVPVMDCLRLIVSRIAIGRSPFEADRDHLHHRLLAVVPERRVLPAYLALALVPGVMAELVPTAAPLFAFSVLLVYLLVLRITSPARRATA